MSNWPLCFDCFVLFLNHISSFASALDVVSDRSDPGLWDETTGGWCGGAPVMSCVSRLSTAGRYWGVVDELEKGSVEGAGLDEEPGVGTDDGVGLPDGFTDEPVKRRAY